MTRNTKRLKPRQPQKNKAAVYRFQPLSPRRAFEAIVKQAQRLSLTTFSYSDGIGVYSLYVGEGVVKLECRVGHVRAYAHSYQFGALQREHVNQIIDILKTPRGQRIASASEVRVRPQSNTVTPLKMGNENARDQTAAKNFRDATRSQVHVISRKAVCDLVLGRTPGHIGDLK